jgi:pyridoxal biosynthesis lyase PdxS
MKALIILIILVVIGFIAYTQFFAPLSEEENEVKQLEKRFNSATRLYLGAERIAGGTGLDTTSDVEEAIRSMNRARSELMRLQERLEEEAAIKRAKKLEAKMKEFYEKNEIFWQKLSIRKMKFDFCNLLA